MNYSRASAIVVSRNPGMMAHSISSSSGGDRRGADTCCGPRALAPLVACIFVARDGLRSRFAPSPLARAGGRTHARSADDGPAQKNTDGLRCLPRRPGVGGRCGGRRRHVRGKNITIVRCEIDTVVIAANDGIEKKKK